MLNNELVSFLTQKIEEIAFSKVKPSDELLASGILDSVNVVELSVEIENHLKIKIPFEDINATHFQSVESITHYLSKSKS